MNDRFSNFGIPQEPQKSISYDPRDFNTAHAVRGRFAVGNNKYFPDGVDAGGAGYFWDRNVIKDIGYIIGFKVKWVTSVYNSAEIYQANLIPYIDGKAQVPDQFFYHFNNIDPASSAAKTQFYLQNIYFPIFDPMARIDFTCSKSDSSVISYISANMVYIPRSKTNVPNR